jgi:hypothetical protein
MAMNNKLLRPKATAAAPTGTPASLLLHFDGSFADSSPNALTVTANGDAAINTTTKKYGSGSAYFDGDGDLSHVDGQLPFQFGDGSWTIEAWVNLPSEPTSGQTLVSKSIANVTQQSSNSGMCEITLGENGDIRVVVAATSDYGAGWFDYHFTTPSGNFSAGTWKHIAVCRDGEYVKCFWNGSMLGSVLYGPYSIYPGTDVPLLIGARHINSLSGFDQHFNGYIDDLRIVKGLAVYEGPFIPPTAPLSVYATPAPVQAAASLLLHFDGDFSDSSPSALTVTANGNAAISTTEKKYGTGSAFAEGNGQYLTLSADAYNFGTRDFTIEWWQYIYAGLTTDAQQALWGNGRVAGIANGLCCYVQAQSYAFNKLVVDGMVGESWHSPMLVADSPFIPQQWQHCAVTRSGGVYRLWIDGVEQDSYIDSGALEWPNAAPASILSVAGNSGEFTSSSVATYVDDFRVVPGLAVYTGRFIPPASPLSVYATPAPVIE